LSLSSSSSFFLSFLFFLTPLFASDFTPQQDPVLALVRRAFCDASVSLLFSISSQQNENAAKWDKESERKNMRGAKMQARASRVPFPART
jgi:hypothetical protein